MFRFYRCSGSPQHNYLDHFNERENIDKQQIGQMLSGIKFSGIKPGPDESWTFLLVILNFVLVARKNRTFEKFNREGYFGVTLTLCGIKWIICDGISLKLYCNKELPILIKLSEKYGLLNVESRNIAGILEKMA